MTSLILCLSLMATDVPLGYFVLSRLPSAVRVPPEFHQTISGTWEFTDSVGNFSETKTLELSPEKLRDGMQLTIHGSGSKYQWTAQPVRYEKETGAIWFFCHTPVQYIVSDDSAIKLSEQANVGVFIGLKKTADRVTLILPEDVVVFGPDTERKATLSRLSIHLSDQIKRDSDGRLEYDGEADDLLNAIIKERAFRKPVQGKKVPKEKE